MSLAEDALMDRRNGTRVVIAESGSPWFWLVKPSKQETVVIAQTPGERETDFGRRIKDRLATLGASHVADILVVTRRRARERAAAAAQWTVERLPRDMLAS